MYFTEYKNYKILKYFCSESHSYMNLLLFSTIQNVYLSSLKKDILNIK